MTFTSRDSAQLTVFQGFCQAALPPHNVWEPSLGFQNLARMAGPTWHLSVRHLCTMQYWSSHPVQQEWIQVGISNYAPITWVDLSLSLFSSISSDLGRPVAILKCLCLFRVTGYFLTSSSVFRSLLAKCLHIDNCQLSWFSEKCLIWIDPPSRARSNILPWEK